MAYDAGGLLVVMMDPEPGFAPQLNKWYDEEHFPERMQVPGFLSGRRFEALDGRFRYLAIYELEDPAVLQTTEYRDISDNPSPWTQEVRKRTTISRGVYLDITPDIAEGFVPRRQPADRLWAH